jgi:hypothetical protein
MLLPDVVIDPEEAVVPELLFWVNVEVLVRVDDKVNVPDWFNVIAPDVNAPETVTFCIGERETVPKAALAPVMPLKTAEPPEELMVRP